MRFYFGKLLKDTLVIFLKNYKYILLISLFVYLPFNIVVLVLFAEAPQIDMQLIFDEQTVNAYRPFASMLLILRSVFLPLVGAAYTYVAGQCFKNESISIPGILDVSLLKWPKLVFTAILCLSVYSLTSFLFIVPIYFAVYFMFYQNVIANTNLWGFRAIMESMAMIRGRWWKMFGVGSLLILILIITSLFNTVILLYIVGLMSPILSGLPILTMGIGIIIKSFLDSFSSLPQLALAVYFHYLIKERGKVPV